MLQMIALLCLVVIAAAAPPTDVVPLEKQQPTVIPIVSQSEEFEPNGTYKFSYETGNGIKREETSYSKVVPRAQARSAGSDEGGESESDEIHVQQGSYSYTAPDGTLISVRYIADENGFQAFGDHIPRSPSASFTSAEKSGRALNIKDSADAASAPAVVARSGVAEQSVPVSNNEDKTEETLKSDSIEATSTSEGQSAEASTPAGSEITTKTDSDEAKPDVSTTEITESISSEASTAGSSEASTTAASDLSTTEAASSDAPTTTAIATTETASTTEIASTATV